MSTAIVWFRQDLRCADNPALAQACNDHQQIIPIYIHDSHEPIGRAACWWLHHSLLALKQELAKHNIHLNLQSGNPLTILQELIQAHSVDTVYWNRLYEPAHIERDSHIKAELTGQGITVISSNSALLNEPWKVKTQQGSYFKVFTPFWKQCLRQMSEPPQTIINQWPSSPTVASDSLESLQLLPTKPNWASGFESMWQPGENGANAHLMTFIEDILNDYKDLRNVPAKNATSNLSPHLHFGEISPWKIWRVIQQTMQDPKCNMASADNFLSQLGWREFSYHLLFHYPDLPHTNYRRQFDRFPWHQDPVALKCWQQGLTGFPIVDAGMRELWRTGYMHNRVRMIVASFLIKDLLIDWREGAAWFLDTLVDADLANNSASWQWVAGSGMDAAPYFRIFNPTLQGEKFDPQGEYIKRWIPELASIPAKWIHQPWTMPGCQINYPKPIIDHKNARELALSYYKQLKQ